MDLTKELCVIKMRRFHLDSKLKKLLIFNLEESDRVISQFKLSNHGHWILRLKKKN
ncbi:MAG: hypothetical protein ACR2LR_28480 [Hassallia sp.]